MSDTARLSLGLGMFRDWIDAKGNLHPSQMRKTFRAALLIGAEYILRVHGLARNPGMFPLSRMQVAPLMGLDEAVVKRCIPIWKKAGLLRQMSILTRRRDDFLSLFPKSRDREPPDVQFCPHQYLLGEAFEGIFGLKDGAKFAESPAENQSGQEKLTTFSGLIFNGSADSEPDLSKWAPGISVRFSEETQAAEARPTPNLPAPPRQSRRRAEREPEFESAPWDAFEPQSLTEALRLLQATIEHLNSFPGTIIGKPSRAFLRAQQSVEQAKGWVGLFEALQTPFKPLSSEAMRSSMRLAPFRR